MRSLLLLTSCLLTGGTSLAQFQFQATSYPVGPSPDAAAVGDFDGDGDADLAVSSDAPDKVSILSNAGNGTFGAPVPVLLGSGASPHTPAAGDVDGDGDVDLAVSVRGTNSVRLLVNTAGVFNLGPSFPVGAEPRDLVARDLDGDGDVDFVVSNRSGNSVSVLRNQGGLSFAVTSFAAGLEPREIDVGDVTGDGLPDIAVAAHDSDAVVLLRNNGGASFVPHASLPTGGNSPEGITLGRLDGNATLDVAVSVSNNNVELALVFLNAGGGAFGGGAPFALGGQDSGSLVAADLDADGDRDLASANEETNNVSALPGSGAGAFGAAQLFGVGAAPTHVLAADLDGNGAADLVTTNDGSGNVTVLLNQALGGTPMVATCFPGEAGVRSCPCQNPPADLGQGCDNSSGTGGAVLDASGAASLAADSLAFTTSGERRTALSIVVQGPVSIPAGAAFGQGVRCVGGTLKRLYTKTAASGSITAPVAGDPSVSARSAALGSPISAGQRRFYLVYYRDGVILGGCSPASTFNATQGGAVSWQP